MKYVKASQIMQPTQSFKLKNAVNKQIINFNLYSEYLKYYETFLSDHICAYTHMHSYTIYTC